MARIPLGDPDDEDTDLQARQTLEHVRALRVRAADPHVYGAVANDPQALQRLVELGATSTTRRRRQRELAHVGDDELPQGLHEPDEAAVVRCAQRSTRRDPIDEATDSALTAHFTREQILEICFTIGLPSTINRFHGAFLSEVDPQTQEVLAPSCPLSCPDAPASGWETGAQGFTIAVPGGVRGLFRDRR